MDIWEFLEARLGEDERLANEALDARTPANLEKPHPAQVWRARYHTVVQRREDRQPYPDHRIRHDIADCGGLFGMVVAEHIVRHDPARVLRDVALTRLLVADLCATEHRLVDDWYSCRALDWAAWNRHDGPDPWVQVLLPGEACTCGRDDDVERRLRLIAARWSNHPDFDPSWSPEATT